MWFPALYPVHTGQSPSCYKGPSHVLIILKMCIFQPYRPLLSQCALSPGVLKVNVPVCTVQQVCCTQRAGVRLTMAFNGVFLAAALSHPPLCSRTALKNIAITSAAKVPLLPNDFIPLLKCSAGCCSKLGLSEGLQ